MIVTKWCQKAMQEWGIVNNLKRAEYGKERIFGNSLNHVFARNCFSVLAFKVYLKEKIEK